MEKLEITIHHCSQWTVHSTETTRNLDFRWKVSANFVKYILMHFLERNSFWYVYQIVLNGSTYISRLLQTMCSVSVEDPGEGRHGPLAPCPCLKQSPPPYFKIWRSSDKFLDPLPCLYFQPNLPTDRRPHIAQVPWTGTTPTGSSTFSL